MYSFIDSSFIEGKKIFFALMVATMQSDFWLSKKVSSVNLAVDEAEQFLLLNNFQVIIPNTKIAVNDLVNAVAPSDSLVIFTSDKLNPIIGSINNTYYLDINCDSVLVDKYYINHDIGQSIKYACTMCGNCCRGAAGSFMIATMEEAEKIAASTGKSIFELFDTVVDDADINKYCVSKLKNGRCKFLTSDNKCEIINNLSYNCQLKVLAYLFMPIFYGGVNFFRCHGIGNPTGNTYTISEINADIAKYYNIYPILDK